MTSAFINHYVLRVTSRLALRHISSHISTCCIHKTLLYSASEVTTLQHYTNVVIIIITIILLLKT